ncbi:FkbM family methyltransferase [Acinetobacter sp. ANC 4639]
MSLITVLANNEVEIMSFISYAQNFEDVMLWRALKHISEGFYIDIGAQHPTIDSVSKAFYDVGWHGVHVEPSSVYAELLRKERENDFIIQAAISDHCGMIDFFEVKNTGLSTGIEQYANQHINEMKWDVKKSIIPCVTLDAILEKVKPKEIHWLKIDVEGMEDLVFKGWNLEYKPWVVVVEATKPNSQELSIEWEELILLKNYKYVYFDGLNRFYLSNNHLELENFFSYPPCVFDNFTKNCPDFE